MPTYVIYGSLVYFPFMAPTYDFLNVNTTFVAITFSGKNVKYLFHLFIILQYLFAEVLNLNYPVQNRFNAFLNIFLCVHFLILKIAIRNRWSICYRLNLKQLIIDAGLEASQEIRSSAKNKRSTLR